MKMESDVRIVSRMIKVKLTALELADYGKQAGALSGELLVLQDEMDALKKRLKARIDASEGKLSEILYKLKTGEEKRDVDCIEVKDFENNKVRYLFENEVVEERAMQESDRQVPLLTPRAAEPIASNENEKEEVGSIGDVIREETNRNTKHSSVDGPVLQ